MIFDDHDVTDDYFLSPMWRHRVLGTALGQDIYTQKSMPNGHYNHIDTINEVRRLGSIQAFVESGQVRNGIMYECVRHQVPFVLVGSIRDDGPLPDVIPDVYDAQDAMRQLAVQRGVAVKDYLAGKKLQPERLFLGAPRASATSPASAPASAASAAPAAASPWSPRVELALTAR